MKYNKQKKEKTFGKINSHTFFPYCARIVLFPQKFFVFKFHVSHGLLNVPNYRKQFQVI